MDESDIEFLKKNCAGNYTDSDYDIKALHVFLTNEKVNCHNKKAMDVMKQEGHEIVNIIAKDSIITPNLDEKTKVSLLQSLREKESMKEEWQ